MRVLEYLHEVDFVHGGPPRAVVDLCQVLARRGHEVILASTSLVDVPPSWQEGGEGLPRVLEVPPPALPGQRHRRAQLDALAEAVAAADVVHLHGVWEPANITVSKLARDAGTPWVVTLRGMLDDWNMTQKGLKKRLYLQLGGRRVLEDAACVQCTAEGERAQSQKWFPRGSVRVIPNLMDLSDFESLRGPEAAQEAWPVLNGEGPHLLFLSRLHVKKGLEHLLRAMPKLVEAHSGLQLFIAGPGDTAYVESLKRLASQCGVAGHTHFTGQIGGDLKWSLYEAADLFVLPSSQENFGFVQFEALACQTPVMTTTLVDTWSEIVNSGGGIAVEQSVESILDGVLPLLEDRQVLQEMGRAGREWVFEHLSVEHIIGQIEMMYRDAAMR